MKQITAAYEKDGYFATDISVDTDLLKKSNALLFRVREGPRVRIRHIRFEGNTAFTAKQLLSKIKSNTYAFIFRPGVLSRQQIGEDIDRLRTFYRDRGYLDAQVGRKIDLSPDQKDAIVTFFIEEGRHYTVANIFIEGNTVYSESQIIETMPLKDRRHLHPPMAQSQPTSPRRLVRRLGITSNRVSRSTACFMKKNRRLTSWSGSTRATHTSSEHSPSVATSSRKTR